MTADGEILERIAAAVDFNDRLPLFAAAQERVGPDLVIVSVGAPAEEPGRVAERRGAHTLLHQPDLPDPDPGTLPWPGLPASSRLSLPALLRHEYAHELWRHHRFQAIVHWSRSITKRGVSGAGRQDLDHPECTAGVLAAGLTRYAGRRYQQRVQTETAGNARYDDATHGHALCEAWCELFAFITHPRWADVRERFPRWLRDAEAAMLMFLQLPRRAPGGASR